MSFDPDLLLKLASFALSVGAMVYAFFVNRRKDVDERFKEGSKRMDRHEVRIAALETNVHSMPGKDDMHGLQLQLVEIKGALNTMGATMEGNQKIMGRLESIVSRHEDHLLDGSKR